jgi:hypothetical protein
MERTQPVERKGNECQTTAAGLQAADGNGPLSTRYLGTFALFRFRPVKVPANRQNRRPGTSNMSVWKRLLVEIGTVPCKNEVTARTWLRQSSRIDDGYDRNFKG